MLYKVLNVAEPKARKWLECKLYCYLRKKHFSKKKIKYKISEEEQYSRNVEKASVT